jgi:hypothetical protein
MALTERHAAAACRLPFTAEQQAVFTLGSRDCAAAADPHEPRYPACSDCHTARGFAPLPWIGRSQRLAAAARGA